MAERQMDRKGKRLKSLAKYCCFMTSPAALYWRELMKPRRIMRPFNARDSEQLHPRYRTARQIYNCRNQPHSCRSSN